MLGVSNQEAIAKLNKSLQKGLGDVRAEINQNKIRADLDIQQSVRSEMYDQIKQNNIGVTKRIEELKAQIKRQLNKNEEDIRSQLLSVAASKEEFSNQMQEYRGSMKSLLMAAKSNNLASQQNHNSSPHRELKNQASLGNLNKRSPRGGDEDVFNKKILFLTDKVAALSANIAEI